MKTWIINDLHLGVMRSSGTTQPSIRALREWAHEQHASLLALADDGDRIIVNGDLTDVYDIPLGEALDVYVATADFLRGNPRSEMFWVQGNHDLSKDSSKLGTVAFVGALLEAQFPDNFRVINKAELVYPEIYVIPHVPNQDIFDMELGRVPDGVKWLLLHVNYDNPFAGQMDHSLNLSREQAKAMRERGIRMVLGHEHQQRDLMSGSVVIVGNQFPTSIADCLGNETKRCAYIEDGDIHFVQTWSRDDPVGYFKEVDWEDLHQFVHAPRGFIRVSGKATPEQSADAVKAISALRSKSEAFVITNAVQVGASEDLSEIADSVEDVRSVNVIELLLEMLSPEQGAKVRQLLGTNDAG